MQLLLHIETNSDIDLVLQIAYAFGPAYVFKHIGNGVLETIIDAAHSFNDAQWSLIASTKYSISFVLPASVTPSVPVVPVAAAA